MRSGTCPKCGSNQIAHNIPLADRNEYADKEISIRVVRPTESKIFGMSVQVANAEYIPMRLSLCGACGYAEMYCADMPKLLALLQQGFRLEQGGLS